MPSLIIAKRPIYTPDWELLPSFHEMSHQVATNLKIPLMTCQGIWVNVTIESGAPEFDGFYVLVGHKDAFCFVHHIGEDKSIFNEETYKAAIVDVMGLIWDTTRCLTCEEHLIKRGKKCCDNCRPYISSGMHFEGDAECIICLENPGNVRKMCICGQYICIRCWNRYNKKRNCPHCTQPYPRLAGPESEDD